MVSPVLLAGNVRGFDANDPEKFMRQHRKLPRQVKEKALLSAARGRCRSGISRL
jgi:hypothetical protein